MRLRERYRRRGQQFVYIDESGFERETTRRYGRAPRGQPVHGLRTGRARPRTSLMAARFEGGDFAAPWLFEGTCNTDIFNGWLESQLCPLLHSQHVVILDNAAFHQSAKTRDLVARTGATLLYLPPYSPDLNPIEHDFANLKKIREYNEQTSLDSLVKMYN